MSRRRRGGRTALLAAAVKLARSIGPDDCVLIGGLAVGIHGYVRATDDLDFVSRLPLEQARQRLLAAEIDSRLLRGDVLDGGFNCLKGTILGIPFDVLPSLVPIAWDAAIPLELGRARLNVVDLGTLFELKFKAGGPQDLLDVARLVLKHPDMEQRALELATAYRQRDRLEAWLRDPRILAQAREEAEREAQPVAKPTRPRRGPARRARRSVRKRPRRR